MGGMQLQRSSCSLYTCEQMRSGTVLNLNGQNCAHFPNNSKVVK